MADQIQTPESGGGEGSAVAAPVPVESGPDAKLAAPVETPKPQANSEELKQENIEKPKEALEEAKSDAQNEKPEVSQEVKSEPVLDDKVGQPEETKQEIAETTENKVESQPEQKVEVPVETKTEANGSVENNAPPKDQGDWQQKETELLKKIDELENVKQERTRESLLLELKVREEEIDLLKARVKNLETELQAALSKPSGKNHEMIENIKQQHEELLSKARGMIFDKTKMVKNQELQIEALNTQILSLKDINQITKDLLEIRNSEIKAMEDRLQAMEARFKAEKERYGLVLQRAQTSSNINDDLRKEYETQLALFKQLREKYDQRVQALVAENERLKGLNPAPAQDGGAGTSK